MKLEACILDNVGVHSPDNVFWAPMVDSEILGAYMQFCSLNYLFNTFNQNFYIKLSVLLLCILPSISVL